MIRKYMNKRMKAVLLAMFVFPGVGHIVFKKYKSASFFIVIALAASVAIMSYVITKARSIADQILSGQVQPDIMVIRELIANQSNNMQTQSVNIATIVLIAVWVLSIFDAYRISNLVDQTH